ncbi:MAG: Spy/CpxP family protein refolding chaperone [Burkholderiales bacterium]|nr:Spy/CpxP family protein refolding chaperone [Burkholderiales bacterium]
MQTPSMKHEPRPRIRTGAWKLLAATSLLALAASLAQPAFAHGAMGMKAGAPMGDMGDMGGGGMMGGMGGMGGGPGMPMMGGRHGARMLDSIGATAEQKTQLQQIMEGARNDLKPLREAARTLHQQMQGLFAQPTVDARAVEALRQQLQANREQASKRMSQAMLDASRVLTPEQRKQMSERMAQRRGMMERHRAERQSLERGAAPGAPAPRQ